jgi:L-aminopeptidase/D-esterase-like protein
VVLCPGGWTAGVDVRGGGPGVRETETLSPENGYARAPCGDLSGRIGLRSRRSRRRGRGAVATGEGFTDSARRTPSAPIVAGAVLYDLANGGDKAWGLDPPYRRLGLEASARRARISSSARMARDAARARDWFRAGWVRPRWTSATV